MSEQNRDSLENFFRERAQNYNLEFNEADWQKLEMQLDQELPVAFSFFAFIKKFWFIPVLLLLIPSLWFTLTQTGNENPNISSQIEKINEGQSKLDSPADAFTKIDKKESSTSTIKYNQQDLSKTEAGNSSQEMTSIESSNQENQYEAFLSVPPGETEEEYNKKTDVIGYAVLENGAGSDKTEAGNSSQEMASNESSNEENQNEALVSVPPGETKEEYNKNTDVIGYAVLENGAGSDKTESDLMLHFLFPITPEPTINEINSIEIEKGEIIKGNSSKPAKRSGLFIGVGYSPDFSTVGIGNFVAPGSRWNVALEYGFSRRFMINTGVVWVQNKYEAYGEDYHAPARYWKKGIVADEAYGECVMVDLPLNIRYNVFENGKHQLFVTAGASTYFLLKEDYYFHYEQVDPELPEHWGTDKMTIYPFGIINFSIGYQMQIAQKSALQIEPFIKIPTAGIGWGNVNLYTMGIYFMYKYRLTKN